MPVIRSQHQNEAWRPLQEWPEDCTVQWGGKGIVLGKERSYGTAFFEAFPADGSAGFIRGEGKTVEEAEIDAFAKYSRNIGCARDGGHRWTRSLRLKATETRERNGRKGPKLNTYLNGGTFCRRCGAFQTTMKPVHELGDWRRPLSNMDLDAIASGMTRDRADGDRDGKAWRRRLHLRGRMAGMDLPDPDAPENRDERRSILESDAFTKACERAVGAYYARRKAEAVREGGAMEALFDGMARRGLERLAKEHGLDAA